MSHWIFQTNDVFAGNPDPCFQDSYFDCGTHQIFRKRNISVYFPWEKYELLVLGYFDAIILLLRVSFCEKLSFPFLQSYLEGIKMKIIIWKIRCLLLKNPGKRKKYETWYSISNKSTCFWSLCPAILEVTVNLMMKVL